MCIKYKRRERGGNEWSCDFHTSPAPEPRTVPTFQIAPSRPLALLTMSTALPTKPVSGSTTPPTACWVSDIPDELEGLRMEEGAVADADDVVTVALEAEALEPGPYILGVDSELGDPPFDPVC
jgi:hypothetical protein